MGQRAPSAGQANTRPKIDRSSLPSPQQYLDNSDLPVVKSKGNWALVRCPVHKGGDERHASMGVSLVDGHVRCHACGAKGGDIVALHRLVTNLGFVEAVKALGGKFL